MPDLSWITFPAVDHSKAFMNSQKTHGHLWRLQKFFEEVGWGRGNIFLGSPGGIGGRVTLKISKTSLKASKTPDKTQCAPSC